MWDEHYWLLIIAAGAAAVFLGWILESLLDRSKNK